MEGLRVMDNGKQSGVEQTSGEYMYFYSGANVSLHKLWQWVLLQWQED